MGRTSTSITYFIFNDTATTKIYTLSLHDALPISRPPVDRPLRARHAGRPGGRLASRPVLGRQGSGEEVAEDAASPGGARSEEHTSELQSRQYLVCRLLLEKKTYSLSRYYSLLVSR